MITFIVQLQISIRSRLDSLLTHQVISNREPESNMFKKCRSCETEILLHDNVSIEAGKELRGSPSGAGDKDVYRAKSDLPRLHRASCTVFRIANDAMLMADKPVCNAVQLGSQHQSVFCTRIPA
jgi:hypothetical protein